MLTPTSLLSTATYFPSTRRTFLWSYLCHDASQTGFMIFSVVSAPVFGFRLADRHAGPAAWRSSPHPALLPRGSGLPVLRLQESLLQTRGRHAVLRRSVLFSMNIVTVSNACLFLVLIVDLFCFLQWFFRSAAWSCSQSSS